MYLLSVLQEKTSERYAETALSKYTELRHIEGQAEAKLFLGKLTGNLRLLKDGNLILSKALSMGSSLRKIYIPQHSKLPS